MSPLAPVVTHKTRIITDLLLDEKRRGKKGGLNGDTGHDTIPQCLCAHALPKFLDELVALRMKFPVERILKSKVDVADAFRNVRVDPDQARNVGYTVEDLVAIDFRLTFGWSGSPGFWGGMSAEAGHAHCNTTLNTTQLLNKGEGMMARVKVVDRREEGTPTPIPSDANVRAHSGDEISDPLFATVYVDDYQYLVIRVQHSDDDKTALIASASLASDHVRFFGPREKGMSPILAPKKSANWDSTIDALGFTINSHTMRISFSRAKANDIKRLLLGQWPVVSKRASTIDVLSMAGKLWNLTYVVRAGRYFVWRLLRLTGLNNESASRQKQNRMIELGRAFRADLLFRKWTIYHELPLEVEALSAPCYTAIRRPDKRHYLSGASVEAVGGLCVEKKLFWRYGLPTELTAEHNKKADLQETGTITTNLLEIDTGNGCDCVGDARINRIQARRGRRPDSDARR